MVFTGICDEGIAGIKVVSVALSVISAYALGPLLVRLQLCGMGRFGKDCSVAFSSKFLWHIVLPCAWQDS